MKTNRTNIQIVTKGRMPMFLAIVGILLATTTLVDCGNADRAALEVKEGYLYSPHGRFKFKKGNLHGLPNDNLFAFDGLYGIYLHLFPDHSHTSLFEIIAQSKQTKININHDASYYQFNNGEKITLKLDEPSLFNPTRMTFEENWNEHFPSDKKNKQEEILASKIYITPPPQMRYYTFDYAGGHLKTRDSDNKAQYITEDIKNKLENEWYRYYISFAIDDRPYAIDVTFRLKIGRKTVIRAPGT